MVDIEDPTQPVRLLTPEGELVEDPRFRWRGGDGSLVEMFRGMRRGRRFDVEGAALQRHGELGLWPPLVGQEGYQAGIAAALDPADMVFATYREQSLALAMGVSPADILALWRGAGLSRWDSAATRMAPYSLIIGSHPLHAVGYALGVALGCAGDGPAPATLTVYGDGASSQGDVNEALVFAAARRAPVVFCCVNNGWAISEPVTRQSPIPLYQRAHGFGIPGIRVDGNDPLACAAVMDWALGRARAGSPVLVEALTYRMGAHTTSDDPGRYRSDELTRQWAGRDPIERLQTHLLARGLVDRPWLEALDAELDDFGAEVRRTCRELVDTPIERVFDDLLVEPGAHLAEQRAECLDWLSTVPGSTVPGEEVGA